MILKCFKSLLNFIKNFSLLNIFLRILSIDRVKKSNLKSLQYKMQVGYGAPEKSRTPNLQIRSPCPVH